MKYRLALTSVHSGFHKCFCSELSFKSIHNHTTTTVFKEGKLNHKAPVYSFINIDFRSKTHTRHPFNVFFFVRILKVCRNLD